MNFAVEHLLHAAGQPSESPIWDDERRCLWWVEIDRRRLHRFDPTSGTDREIELPRPVGAVGLCRDRRLVLALDDGIWLIDPDSAPADLDQLCLVEADDPSTRANDGAAAPDGTYWIGTMAVDASPDAGSLYRVDRRGGVTSALSPVSISNGIGWLGPHEALYVDSLAHSVDVIRIDPQSHRCVDRRPLVHIDPEDGLPDGLTVDAEDAFWVAIHGAGEVRRYSPTGELLDTVHVPATGTTSCTFGGDDLADLYITAMDTTGSDGGLYRCHIGPIGAPANQFDPITA